MIKMMFQNVVGINLGELIPCMRSSGGSHPLLSNSTVGFGHGVIESYTPPLHLQHHYYRLYNSIHSLSLLPPCFQAQKQLPEECNSSNDDIDESSFITPSLSCADLQRQTKQTEAQHQQNPQDVQDLEWRLTQKNVGVDTKENDKVCNQADDVISADFLLKRAFIDANKPIERCNKNLVQSKESDVLSPSSIVNVDAFDIHYNIEHTQHEIDEDLRLPTLEVSDDELRELSKYCNDTYDIASVANINVTADNSTIREKGFHTTSAVSSYDNVGSSVPVDELVILSNDNASPREKLKKKVRFGTVSVQEYEVTVGASNTTGYDRKTVLVCPIQLNWSHTPMVVVDLYEYELSQYRIKSFLRPVPSPSTRKNVSTGATARSKNSSKTIHGQQKNKKQKQKQGKLSRCRRLTLIERRQRIAQVQGTTIDYVISRMEEQSIAGGVDTTTPQPYVDQRINNHSHSASSCSMSAPSLKPIFRNQHSPAF